MVSNRSVYNSFQKCKCARIYGHTGGKINKIKNFFAKKQSLFINNLKSNLQEGEFLVCCDFAENYAFVMKCFLQEIERERLDAPLFLRAV